MQLATTLQFRQAVRTALVTLGVEIPEHSWTEGAGRGSDIRYVGYPFWGMPSGDKLTIAVATERLLAAKGLTAKTRISKRGYLRGTGVL